MNRPVPVPLLLLLAVLASPAGLSAQAPEPAPPRPPRAPAAPQSPLSAVAPQAPRPPAEPQPPRPPAPAQRERGPLTSLDVQVVISRYQGQQQISRLPYTLAVTANAPNAAVLNMGADVPVPTTTFAPAPPASQPGGGPPPAASVPVQSMSYRPVGTLISCRAAGGEDGRFEVVIDVDDSSIFTSDQAAPPVPVAGTMPVFRSFKSRNTLMLQDGQTRQYTAAADRVSGEVVRIELTLRVVK